MSPKQNKGKATKVNKKTLDKRNYFFFALAGVLLIGILMILQTRFKEYYRLNNDGFAVVSNTVTEFLILNPSEEDVESLVKMQSFEALDILYTQAGKFFLGDKEKIEVDTSYPVFMNQGAVLHLIDGTGVLFDANYEKEETYQGLYIEGGYAYNPDGQKADHSAYKFLGMNNGNFVNFENITYTLKNENLDINENSLVHFDSDYFSYYEYEKGELIYKYCVSVTDTFKLKVGEIEYTYDELLKLLGLRSEYPDFEGIKKDELIEDDEIEDEGEGDFESSADVEVKKPQKDKPDLPTAPTPGGGSGNTNSSPGIRPPGITRPGSSGTTVTPPDKVDKYVQPQVTVNSVTANVYRIIVDTTIFDPASRIDSSKYVRYEVFEIDKDGKEQLAMRGYRRGEGKDTTVLGGGAIKPETKYKVIGYYTYYDEYNNEQYVDLGSWQVTTGKFEDLTDITLTHHEGTRYHNHIEVIDFGYDAAVSDDELVYGINPHGGIVFTVKENSTDKVVTTRKLTASEVNNFKFNKGVILSSLNSLKAKTEYKYEFIAKDYFDNDITLINDFGFAMTSNNAPNAEIVEKTNEIGKIILGLTIKDIDAAAVPSFDENDSDDACDVYVIITKEDPLKRNYENLQAMIDAGVVVAYKKLAYGQYSYDPVTGLTTTDLDVQFNNLRLGEKFFATVYGDYDLTNRMGPQYYKPIGQMSFKTADLNSLGKIYVTSDLDLQNLTHKSLPMSFHLNEESTDDQLEKLITGMKIDIVRGDGVGDDAIIDASFSFDENSLTSEGTKVLDVFKDTAVSYFADNLQSMTEYRINAIIYARYQNDVYEVIPQLTNFTFKTLRRPPEIVVDDLLFAAGTLMFDVKVADPDETIIGVSGDKVVLQLYTQRGDFVKTIRVLKDLDEWQTVTFNALNPKEKYEIRFIAVEYNEGYTNATYISNKLLKTVSVDKSFSLDGTIKLESINATSNSEKYNAVVKATLSDPDYNLSGADAIPYYIRVEKDGVLIEDVSYDLSSETPSTIYEKIHNYSVDKGDHTYRLTMYIIVSDRVVELDTLTFTTETTVKGFGTAYEMIQLINADSDGKFVATNDFVFNSNTWNFKGVINPGDVESMSAEDLNALGKGLSGTNIANIFNGNIDFQGFTMYHNIYADNQRLFTNIGSKGIIHNLVYSVKNLNTGRIYDDAAMCYRNFGTIRDIFVKYRGGYVVTNEYYGILARVNSSTGIIENFVIENIPEEGWAGFNAYRYAGLATYDNYGIIRYGYVYGDNIITTTIEQSLTREIGGIAGANRTIGNMYSVYSLLNVDENSMRLGSNSAYSYGNYYGAVCGQSWGKMSNMYSTKDSMNVESKHNSTHGYQHSPIIGGRNYATNSNIYYYSDETYSEALSRTKAYKLDLNQLYDVTWQKSMLTESFDTSLVEVGFYPHVKLSGDLPEQQYIPLPTRVIEQPVEISRATVKEYGIMKDGVTDYALVEFVFMNRDGFDIVGLTIDNIDVEMDLQTAKYEDGYTTIYGVVSNPRTFTSEYEIKTISYYNKGKLTNNTVSYTLKADFFRKIYTVDDWYNYMVKRKNANEFENVRLEKDLDFAGVDPSRIMVNLGFNRILDGTDSYGNMHKLKNIDLQYGFKAKNNQTVRRLFIGALDYSGVVRNLYVENYDAGGYYKDDATGKTYVARSASMMGDVFGLVENVHMKDVDLYTYLYAAGIACNAANSAEIKDCSVSNIKIIYNDPDDVNADSFIGGLVARVADSRITHCYAKGVNIEVDETKSTYGIGGIVGYSVNSVIDTAYAEGDIVSRAQKVGGIVGHYYCTNASVACMKNMWAKVDVICYTDIAGALVGQTNITQDRISATNNFTGLGIGNVYLSNLDSQNCSQTIGVNIGKNATFYGTTEQLINGRVFSNTDDLKEDCVRGLLTYDQLINDASNSYFEIVGFEKVYSMEGTKDGYLPKMYYTGSSTNLLPNQEEGIVLDELRDVDIDVTHVTHNDGTRIVSIELRNPNNYKITGINLQKDKKGNSKLKYHFVNMAAGAENYPNAVTIDEACDYDAGITRVYLQYDPEQEQEYFLDSYVLDNVSFYPVENSGLDNSLLSANIPESSVRNIPLFTRIDVMLCKNIPTIGEWNKIPLRENEGHTYENYRITADLDFNNTQPAINLKIGRLISDNGDNTLKNIDIEGTDMHLISRLNSGIKGLNFENVKVRSSGVGCVGIIGVSNGTIINCDFSDIIITPLSANTDEVGIIGHCNSGLYENITMNNISVNNEKRTKLDYVGGFVGKIPDGSSFTNIKANNVTVIGTGDYVGGVVGGTEMSSIKNIALSNIKVTNSGKYTGGFAGSLGYSSNAAGREIFDIEIVGTATTDDDGRTIASTTHIKGNEYVGGIAGYTHQKVGNAYQASKTEPNLNVEGVVVSGLQNMGGALGGTYTTMYHLTVKNTLVETRDDIANKTATYLYVGGVLGATNNSTGRALIAENVVIDVDNTNYVGGICGLYRQNAQHCFVKNCLIKANKTSSHPDKTNLQEVGGIAGRYVNNMNYCGVMNTNIYAPKYLYVGGIAGRFAENLTSNLSIGNCFYLADYDTNKESQYKQGNATRYTAAALPEYRVEGGSNVGGIVGYQHSGYVHQSYSNANVYANTSNAGGISGMYCNEFTTTISNGKENYSYSIAGMYRNYFAGTVYAKSSYAGGAIGRTGILVRGQGTGDGKLNGSRIKGVNANCNEVDKTYGNIIIADKISVGSAKNTVGAFASDDSTYAFNGRDNRVWSNTILNNGSSDVYVGSLTHNDGSYVYEEWTGLKDPSEPKKPIESTPAKIDKIQIFKSKDLDGSDKFNDWHNRAVVFYRTADWLKYSTDKLLDYTGRNTYWRVSIGDVKDGSDTRGLKDQYESTGENTGTYLPQVREKIDRKYKQDALIRMQESVCRLPLPRDTGVARTLMLSSGYSMRASETTYGMVYASDIDKVNVEFSNDLLNAGYFTLKAGDTVIANKVITQRTYTFSYPYNQNLTFDYGFLNDTELSESEILNGTNLDEQESILLGPNDLRTDIMVYHNDYYYISEDGLVSSVGTWAGDFVHVMNGKLLDTNGEIWNVESRTKIGSVNVVELESTPSPLWDFQYGSIGIDTFAKYSAIEYEYETIYRNAQIFVVNNELFTVDGSLETRKTDILIYKLNGENYQTVLGSDGMMVDMMQDDWNIPEEVDNQAIVRMSNTLDASVPYVLVEYNNGGIIGYNYATGKILFDNSIINPVSLLDYAVNFFSGDRESQYANISNTYSANKDLSNRIHSSADLEKIIGNSSGEVISGNEYGDNSAPAVGAQNLADSNYAKESDGIIGIGDDVTGQGSDGEKPNGTDVGVDDTDGTFVTTTETNPEAAKKTDENNDSSDTDASYKDDSEKEDEASDKKESDETKDDSSDESSEEDLEEDENAEDVENQIDVSSEKSDEELEKSETTVENEKNSIDSNPNPNPQLPKIEEEKEVGSGEFMTVYNNETGVYEIISVVDYLTVDAYISENHNLGIKDLSKQVSGYAQATVDVNQERGIIMYIVPIFIIFGIAGVIVLYVKRKERKA